MKIISLMDDISHRSDLTAEHGLSLYIETQNHTILYDAGQSDAFSRNAQKLGVDLSRVDVAILSHGHYDHSDGLPRFLQINDHAPVYLQESALEEYYNGTTRYIGLTPDLKSHSRLVFAGEETVIDDELSLCTCNALPRPFPSSGAGLNHKSDGQIRPDAFLHEHYLTIRQGDRRIVISGCSHKGILNIVSWLKPDVLVGGFHFKDMDPQGADRDFLTSAAQTLSASGCTFHTCHCTGEKAFAFLKPLMGDSLHYLATGDSVLI